MKLEVLDSKGRVIRTMAGTESRAGEHKVTWDGKTTGGADAAEGVYSLRITAKDSSGATVTTSTYMDGKVTGVEQKDGSTYLTVNGAQIPWDKLVSIRQPETTQTATTTGDASASGSTNNSDDKTSSPAAA